MTHEAVSASLRVVESAIELARAEARLALVKTRTLASDAGVLVVGALVAMTFLALSLVIVAISPLMLMPPHGSVFDGSVPFPWPLALSFGLSASIATGGGLLAKKAYNRLKTTE